MTTYPQSPWTGLDDVGLHRLVHPPSASGGDRSSQAHGPGRCGAHRDPPLASTRVCHRASASERRDEPPGPHVASRPRDARDDPPPETLASPTLRAAYDQAVGKLRATLPLLLNLNGRNAPPSRVDWLASEFLKNRAWHWNLLPARRRRTVSLRQRLRNVRQPRPAR